jgi:GAF domain-containing protein
MTPRTIADAFADAATRMTQSTDVAGSLVALLGDCAELLGADSAGLLVQVEDTLELLASTSHTTTILELYELQNGTGPCLEALRSNRTVAGGVKELSRQWPPVGQAILDAGYTAVHAFPLRWGDRAVGALNLYAASTNQLDHDRQRVGEAFANLAIAVLAHPRPPDWSAVRRVIIDRLDERIAIEQAKGVLAVQRGVDLSEAYTVLVSTAADRHVPLADYAREITASIKPPP